MIEINVNVTAPEMTDALNNLADAIRAYTEAEKHECKCKAEDDCKESDVVKEEQPAQEEVPFEEENKAPMPEPEPEPAPVAQAAPAKEVTMDDILKTAAPLIDIDGGGAKLMALLKQFGAIGVPQLSKGDYPAFYDGLLAIVKELS